jgi:hypothetical protein
MKDFKKSLFYFFVDIIHKKIWAHFYFIFSFQKIKVTSDLPLVLIFKKQEFKIKKINDGNFLKNYYDFIAKKKNRFFEVFENLHDKAYFKILKDDTFRNYSLNNYGKKKFLILDENDSFKISFNLKCVLKKKIQFRSKKKKNIAFVIPKISIFFTKKKNFKILFFLKIILFPIHFFPYCTKNFENFKVFSNFSTFNFILQKKNLCKINFILLKSFILKKNCIFSLHFYKKKKLKNIFRFSKSMKQIFFFFLGYLKKPLLISKMKINFFKKKKSSNFFFFFLQLKICIQIMNRFFLRKKPFLSLFDLLFTALFSVYVISIFISIKKRKKFKLYDLFLNLKIIKFFKNKTYVSANFLKNVFRKNIKFRKIKKIIYRNSWTKKIYQIIFFRIFKNDTKIFLFLKPFLKSSLEIKRKPLEFVLKKDKKKNKMELIMEIEETEIGSYFLVHIFKNRKNRINFWIFFNSAFQIIKFFWPSLRKKNQPTAEIFFFPTINFFFHQTSIHLFLNFSELHFIFTFFRNKIFELFVSRLLFYEFLKKPELIVIKNNNYLIKKKNLILILFFFLEENFFFFKFNYIRFLKNNKRLKKWKNKKNASFFFQKINFELILKTSKDYEVFSRSNDFF